MEDGYLGTIVPWAGNFEPRGWKFCQGQQMAIQTYAALWSILGSTYGGDNRTYFNLPDLRGAIPMGAGTVPPDSTITTTTVVPGETGGSFEQSLSLPNHTHTFSGSVTARLSVSTGNGTAAGPASTNAVGVLYRSGASVQPSLYAATSTVPGFDVGALSVTPPTLASNTTGVTGSGTPFNAAPPFLAVNYIICIDGYYPPRD